MLNIVDFFDELRLRSSDQVVDLGTGIGRDALLLSKLVGHGKVFAVDVHKDLLEHLETEIKKEKITNVVPVWADFENLEGTRLRDDSIDAILISNTFYLLKHKKTAAMEMKRILKSGGKILFADWYKHLGESVSHKTSVLDEEEVTRLFVDLGFLVYPLIHKDSHHFVLLIEKK